MTPFILLTNKKDLLLKVANIIIFISNNIFNNFWRYNIFSTTGENLLFMFQAFSYQSSLKKDEQLLPITLSHFCHESATRRVLRLHSSSSYLISSDCRTIGRSPGGVRSGKWSLVRQSVICANEDTSGRPRLRERHLYNLPDGTRSLCIWEAM
jgi:hypothetical protein